MSKHAWKTRLEMPSQLFVSLEFDFFISLLDKASHFIPGQEMIDMVLELLSKYY